MERRYAVEPLVERVTAGDEAADARVQADRAAEQRRCGLAGVVVEFDEAVTAQGLAQVKGGLRGNAFAPEQAQQHLHARPFSRYVVLDVGDEPFDLRVHLPGEAEGQGRCLAFAKAKEIPEPG